MYITEDQVQQHLSIRDCIEVLRRAFALEIINIPRYRLKSHNSLMHVMSASIPELGVMGLKSYGTSKSGGSFVVLLFAETTGELLAVVEADAMGQIRTGSASGLATDLLARRDARIGAIIGSGFQADTQLLAIDCVRDFDEIRVYSRSPESRLAFLERMQPQIRARLIDCDSAGQCIRDADVICTITSAKEPVLKGEWLRPGAHINAAGSNWASKRELDTDAVRRCDFICVDHLAQSKIESGDLVAVFGDSDEWNRVSELAEVVKGKAGRTSQNQITLFKSNGIAAEDVAAAHHIYSRLKP